MTRSGKRWTMHCGEALAVLERLDSASVDALICDPPYSSGGFTRGDRQAQPSSKYATHDSAKASETPNFGGDNRDQRAFHYWCALWLSECVRVLRTGSPVGVFTDWRQLPTTTDAIQSGGLMWRGLAVWSKNNCSRPQMGRFRNDAEYFVWGSSGPMRSGEDVGCLPGVWTCAPVSGDDRVHLTQKPLEVMLQAVAIAPPSGVVLDPFAGSASTGVAALRSGRSFVGIERDPDYFRIACERLEAEEAGVSVADMRAGQLSLLGGAS